MHQIFEFESEVGAYVFMTIEHFRKLSDFYSRPESKILKVECSLKLRILKTYSSKHSSFSHSHSLKIISKFSHLKLSYEVKPEYRNKRLEFTSFMIGENS